MGNMAMSNELSFFEAALTGFLHTYHPQKADDRQFIRDRCASAEEEYMNCFCSGANPTEALEIALQVLWGDLEFSLYTILYDLIGDNFPEIPAGKRKEISLAILPEAESLLENYPGASEDDSLRWGFDTELLGITCEYIDTHGI